MIAADLSIREGFEAPKTASNREVFGVKSILTFLGQITCFEVFSLKNLMNPRGLVKTSKSPRKSPLERCDFSLFSQKRGF